MNGGKKPRGYTIIEVMLFLAITGVLLASALAVFQGQSARTQFTQGVRELDARLRTIMNEVGSGYYPNSAAFSCTSDGSGEVTISSISPNEQGANEGCVFLGKIVQFDEETYLVYTLVGPRQAAGKDLQSLETGSAVIAVSSGTGPDVTEQFSLPGGLQIEKVVVASTDYNGELGAIGFVMSLPQYQGGDPVSGSQSLDVISLKDSDKGSDKQEIISQVESLVDSSRATDKVTICLTNGGPRRAAIVIGGEGRQATTDTFIDNVPTECN